MVTHRPDDFRAQCLAGGFDDGPQLRVGFRFTPVSEVAGENHSFGARAGSPDFVEELLEQGVAVHHTVQRSRTAQQVGVTQME
ncbi:hypothetical protein BJG92_03031 [Arthrobacter sp. SO5]|nr:hypothetical protein [Arthrobacter sp. SO5]